MHFYMVYGCVLSLLVLTWAAPISEKLNAAMKKRSADPVRDQENQLKSLLSLAGKNTKLPNTAVLKSHVSHVESTNGQEIKHEEVEEKVLDSQTGDIVSDVKQDVTQDKSDSDNEPHTILETKIDIPAEGVHKTIIQNVATDGDGDNIEFTPTAVAEYLLETGEFENFYTAIQDLVDSNLMSQDEAERYQDEVMSEYQRLLAEIDAYQSELTQQDDAPTYFPQPYPVPIPQKKSNLYDNEGAYIPDELSPESQQAVQDALINNEKSLGAAIDALLEAWWNQAFEAGDGRAQALVEYLYSIVSKDDDMDDIGQIREILAEMLARALMEDLSGAGESQPVPEEVVDSESNSSQEESSEDDTQVEEKSTEEMDDSDESSEETISETKPVVIEDKTAKM